MLVPVDIQINFTANYQGEHRVCYRIGSSGGYNCILVNCAAIGACQALIPVFVDNETCVNIPYEGYIQPTCTDSASPDNRTPWVYTFVPAPACKSYNVNCNSEGVDSVVITNGGIGYNPLSAPAVLFTGGGGTGAAGTAVVGSGSIVVGSVVFVNHGDGYINGTHLNVAITGGSGSGARATVIVAGLIVTSIVITNRGTGYLSSDTLGLNNTDMGGVPITPASFRTTSDYGTVTGINITTHGSGYTTPPVIAIGASGGVQATATSVLSACDAFTTTGCDGVSVDIPQGVLPVGSSMTICKVGVAPVLPVNFGVTLQGNCLCNGVTATIGVSGPVGTSVKYFYNKAGGGEKTGILTVGGSPQSIIDCVVPNSIVFQTLVAGTTGTISLGGAC